MLLNKREKRNMKYYLHAMVDIAGRFAPNIFAANIESSSMEFLDDEVFSERYHVGFQLGSEIRAIAEGTPVMDLTGYSLMIVESIVNQISEVLDMKALIPGLNFTKSLKCHIFFQQVLLSLEADSTDLARGRWLFLKHLSERLQPANSPVSRVCELAISEIGLSGTVDVRYAILTTLNPICQLSTAILEACSIVPGGSKINQHMDEWLMRGGDCFE